MKAFALEAKILKKSQNIREALQRYQLVVAVLGCFDLLHRGHLELFKRACLLGDALIVGVYTDALARELKGRAPIFTEQDRALLLASQTLVDYVIPVEEPRRFLELTQPALLASADPVEADLISLVESWGGSFFKIPKVSSLSTTQIIWDCYLLVKDVAYDSSRETQAIPATEGGS